MPECETTPGFKRIPNPLQSDVSASYCRVCGELVGESEFHSVLMMAELIHVCSEVPRKNSISLS